MRFRAARGGIDYRLMKYLDLFSTVTLSTVSDWIPWERESEFSFRRTNVASRVKWL